MRQFINIITENQNILAEAKMAPLYHGTNLLFLAAIVQDDSLSEGVHWGREGEPNGPRLTRSYRVAMTFATDQELEMGGVLVLDQQAIANRHKIAQYRDVDAYGNQWAADEAEEVPLTSELKPLSRYLLSVNADPAQIKFLMENEDYMSYGVEESEANVVRAFETFDECRTALKNLLDHPKLNTMVPRH